MEVMPAHDWGSWESVFTVEPYRNPTPCRSVLTRDRSWCKLLGPSADCGPNRVTHNNYIVAHMWRKSVTHAAISSMHIPALIIATWTRNAVSLLKAINNASKGAHDGAIGFVYENTYDSQRDVSVNFCLLLLEGLWILVHILQHHDNAVDNWMTNTRK